MESGRAPGHRALHGGTLETPATIEVPEAAAYLDLVRAAGVILDPEERRQRILEQARALAQAEGGQPLDGELADGLTFLVEQPTAFAGGFDPAFLALPREALVLVMRKQQRLFPVVTRGRLLPGSRDHDGGSDGVERAQPGVASCPAIRLRFSYEEDLRFPPSGGSARYPYQERQRLREPSASARSPRSCATGKVGHHPPDALRAALLAKRISPPTPEGAPGAAGRIGQAYASRGRAVRRNDALAGHYFPRSRNTLSEQAGRSGAADRTTPRGPPMGGPTGRRISRAAQ